MAATVKKATQNSGEGPVRMDSRKFIGALNESIASKQAFFEQKIQEMGHASGRNWKLAALRLRQINRDQQYTGDLFIEDVDTHEYYSAECRREKGGRIVIEQIRPIILQESEKQSLFEQNCRKLVDAIEENNQRNMASAFQKLAGQRFSSRAVPVSGIIRTKDGVIRHVHVTAGPTENVKPRLVAAIVESLRDRVIVEGGLAVSGTFRDGGKVRLPVTKWGAKKLVGKHMREAAQNAYWSSGFQNRILRTARLIYEDKVSEAVKYLSPFLRDNEEFTLLSRKQVVALIENALAAKAQFNQQLCEDTAQLFYRTNLRVNRETILREWRNIALKTEHPVLLENVGVLEGAKHFEAAYEKFLELIFEAISNREITAEALASTLETLRNRTPKIKESHDLSSKLGELITRLKGPEVDDNAIYEAEDLIATIQEELSATENLSDFDNIPGGTADPLSAGGSDMGGGGGGAPVIHINAPLVSIGSQNTAGGGTPEPPAEELPADDMEDSDDELDQLLGAANAQPPSAAPPAAAPPAAGAPPPAGRIGEGKEWQKPWEKPEKEQESQNDSSFTDESDDDPYALEPDQLEEGRNMFDYGTPAITDVADVERVVQAMERLATEQKLQGPALQERLGNLAKAGLKESGLRIPTHKVNVALEQVIGSFLDSYDDGVVEDQYKGPIVKPLGLARSSIIANESKARTNTGGLVWLESTEDAVSGTYSGLPFIFDHGGDSEFTPVLLSEDGQLEIGIPEELWDSAFAAAELASGDAGPFLEWLAKNVPLLQPATAEEDRLLAEAMATITAGPDGTITVEVGGDAEIGGDTDTGMETEHIDMAPVDSVISPEDAELDTDGAMPDFDAIDQSLEDMPADGADTDGEDIDDVGDESEPVMDGDMPGDEDEEDDEVLEDKDITDPESAKYSKHVKDNKRGVPDRKLPDNADDTLDEIGPEVHKDDGSGTKSTYAKKG